MAVVGTNWRLYKTSCRLQYMSPRCWKALDTRKLEEPGRRGITQGPDGWLDGTERLRAVPRGIPGREGSQEILWACLSSLESIFPRRRPDAILLLPNSSLGHLMFSLSSKQEKGPACVLVPRVGFPKGACPAAGSLSSPLRTTLLYGVGPVRGWRGFLKPSICRYLGSVILNYLTTRKKLTQGALGILLASACSKSEARRFSI